MRYWTITLFVCFLTYLSPAQWTPFCSGSTNGYIVELDVINDTLYTVGFPTNVCSESIQHVGKYDGSSWSSVAGGHSDAVHSIQEINGALHIAPYEFGNSPNAFRVLNGGVWQDVGDAVQCSYYNGLDATPSLYDVVEFNGELHACGEFDIVGTDSINCIMRWNGSQWLALANGLTGSTQNGSQNVRFPHRMYEWNGQLLVAGNFAMAGNVLCNGIASWDGTQWSAMGQGFDNTVYDLIEYNGELYACGAFESSGATLLERMAKWDGSNWVSAGFELPGNSPPTFAHTMKEIGGLLYIGGGFTQVDVGGNIMSCGNIISWDGTSINTMMGGTDLEVEGIVEYNSSVLVGGGFTMAGGAPASGLAYWEPANTVSEYSEFTLNVHPNPANETIVIDGLSRNGVQVFSIDGKEFPVQVLGNSMIVSHLPNGMYSLVDGDRKTRFQIQH